MAQINELISKILLRNDSKENWGSKNPTLMKGEAGIEFVSAVEASEGVEAREAEINIKIGDGITSWNDLPYALNVADILAKIPDVDLSEVTNNVQVIDGTVADLSKEGRVIGDIGIVRAVIDGEIKSYTAYVWNGIDWAAMDGNYNAANVYYDKDIEVTQNVGNVTTSNNAPVPLRFKGKNMEQIWQYLYATEDLALSITQPKTTLSVSPASVNQEIGTTFNDPTVTLTFADGSYEYGSKDEAGTSYTTDKSAGVVWNAATITGPNSTAVASMTAANSNKTISKIYDISADAVVTAATSNVVSEGTKTYSFSSKASCPASVRKPITNLGNFVDAAGEATGVYADGKNNTAAITDQSKSATLTVTGWRGWFEGYNATGSELDVASLTSAQIRALAKGSTKGARNGSFSTSMTNVPIGTNQLIFACPTGKINFTLKDDNVTVNTGFTVAQSTPPAPWTVRHTTASVAGADGNNAITYDVFYCNDVGTIDKQTLTIAYTKK